MDLYVEKQCVSQMKAGNVKQFLMLFDAGFDDLYKYVARRVDGGADVRGIVRETFLDALGRIQNTPEDSGYLIWLYSLAYPSVSDSIAKASFPEKTGFISGEDLEGRSVEDGDVAGMAEKVMKKMTMEEREIVRLKFFEQVSDGDVMMILGSTEETIGSKIYRVLKRLHFFLFGDASARKGVYFGDVSGFFEKVRELEKIEIQDIFKLELRTTISNKIDRQEFAVETEIVSEMEAHGVGERASVSPFDDGEVFEEDEVDAGVFEVKNEKDILSVGSDDPAKIFVKASQEMTAEDWADLEAEKQEKIRKMEEEVRAEAQEAGVDAGVEEEMAYSRDFSGEAKEGVEGEVDVGEEENVPEGIDYEKVMDFLERWKGVFIGVPIFLFFVVGAFVVLNIFVFTGKIERGYPTICVAAKSGIVDFSGGVFGGLLPSNNPVKGDSAFYDAEKRAITSQIIDRACGTFKVENLVAKKGDDTTLKVNVAIKDWKMEYKFVKKGEQWRIKKFLKTYESGAKISVNSDDKSGKV